MYLNKDWYWRGKQWDTMARVCRSTGVSGAQGGGAAGGREGAPGRWNCTARSGTQRTEGLRRGRGWRGRALAASSARFSPLSYQRGETEDGRWGTDINRIKVVLNRQAWPPKHRDESENWSEGSVSVLRQGFHLKQHDTRDYILLITVTLILKDKGKEAS